MIYPQEMFHVRLRRLRTLLLLGWVFYICLFGLVGLVLFKSSISLLTFCLDVLSSIEDEILKLQCAVIELSISPFRVSLVAQKVKHLAAMWETQVQSLGWEESPGEGNGNPLQYSCLENPMDSPRGAWQATVHRVAKSRTRLSGYTFTFYFSLQSCECWLHLSGSSVIWYICLSHCYISLKN